MFLCNTILFYCTFIPAHLINFKYEQYLFPIQLGAMKISLLGILRESVNTKTSTHNRKGGIWSCQTIKYRTLKYRRKWFPSKVHSFETELSTQQQNWGKTGWVFELENVNIKKWNCRSLPKEIEMTWNDRYLNM